MTGLLGWLERAHAGRGVRFARDGGSWELQSWEAIARIAHSSAAFIAEHAREPGTVVAIALPNGREFVGTFFGALWSGRTPCVLAPPNPLQTPEQYVASIGSLLRAARPGLALTTSAYLPLVERAASASRLAKSCPVERLELDSCRGNHVRAATAPLALLQFTAGSAGEQRAVRVSFENLETNIDAILRWLQIDPERDQAASWLPHYHDMGLIGCLLAPAVAQMDMWVMRPEQFIQRPSRWLECLGARGATMTASPTFGFAYALRRVSDGELEGLDFSSWRVAIVGAERVDAGVLGRFAARLARHGFRASSFVPAYGLAEATLLVAGERATRRPAAVRLDWSALRFGQRVRITDIAAVGELERIGNGAGWLVSCGQTPPGVSLGVVDDDAATLPERHLGELFVTGRSVAQGYHGEDEVGSSRFAAGGLRTGDAGFILHGALYVVGRIGDSLKIRGRGLFMEGLEASLLRIPEIKLGRSVVLAGSGERGDTIVAIVETPPGEWSTEALRVLVSESSSAVDVRVLSARHGTIARTSSGKPRRRLMWQRYVEARLDAELVASWSPRERTEPATVTVK